MQQNTIKRNLHTRTHTRDAPPLTIRMQFHVSVAKLRAHSGNSLTRSVTVRSQLCKTARAVNPILNGIMHFLLSTSLF